jgi:NAD(P)-dependent dehydrogenase (short-subunit alcohol dehydrogenase family)
VKLADTVVAVTGGGSGLGAATCRAARGRGAAQIVVLDRDLAAAEAVPRRSTGPPCSATSGTSTN